MLASEIVHECRYTIEHKLPIHISKEMTAVLLLDHYTKKYSFYIIPISSELLPSASEINKTYFPLSLNFANSFFSDYDLNEENYIELSL